MKKSIKVTYDPDVDAAYVYLTEIGAGGVAKTFCCDAEEVGGGINLDFDGEGRLVGIEILQAKRKLPDELLAPSEDF